MPPVTHVEFNAISARSLKSLREEGEEEQDDVPSNGVRGDPRLDAFSEPEPREPSAFVLTCKAGLESATVFFKRHAATKLFLRTVKEGNTTEALQCLANNPFLLTYRSFAKDGDTVSETAGCAWATPLDSPMTHAACHAAAHMAPCSLN